MTKLDDHPHIIPFGKILRKLCIDELPQLIHVLCGKMSMVGPRPPIPYEVDEYLHWHTARFDAIPGITGLWQVSGKNRLTFDQMIRLDIQYSRQLSIWLDIKIILMTPLAIMSQVKDSFKRNFDMKVAGKNA
jgi:lipopolysaccharide/colanic/teichoic acid biosynthesis glycosyltransferase